jgi:hypothetical protein
VLGGAADVSCRSNKIPQAVVITILSGSCGDHAPIMVPATRGSTDRKRTRAWAGCADENSREKVQNVATDSRDERRDRRGIFPFGKPFAYVGILC